MIASTLIALLAFAATDDISANAASCTPAKAGELVLTSPATDVALTGTTIYTIGGQQNLGAVTVDFLAIDASNRAAPAIRGFLGFAGSGAPQSIEIDGNYAYTATDRGLTIMDIVNRTSPSHVTRIDLPNVNSQQLRVLNGRAYVTGTTFPGPSRLYVVDVTNPASPTILGNYPEDFQNFYDVDAAGTTAYVATHLPAGNLLIIDATNPATMTKVGTFTEPGTNRISNVAVRGNLLIAIGETDDFKDHLLVLDITNRTAPRRLAKIDLATGGAQDIAIVDDRAIILDSGALFAPNGRLLFFDISKPEQITQVAAFTLTSPRQMTAEGSSAVVLSFSTKSVGIYDIGTCLSSPARRRAVGRP